MARTRDEWIGETDDQKDALSADLDFVKACLSTADKVAKSELGADAARKYLEGLA